MTQWRSQLAVGAGLFAVLCWFLTGINWGLPSRRADPYLFGASRDPWSGARIMELAPFGELESNRGADVDVNPIANRDRPVVLNETDRQRAEIVRRYRLFSYQPDEWNTMRSLAGMRPGELKLDPRLYQYGGLWVYGVGALLKVASMIDIVELRGGPDGIAYYLDHPEAFGRFYVVARLYSALWGVVGAWAVYRLASRVVPPAGAAATAACYALMPVVVNQAHEAKPHLAGLALMLLAILAACRYVESGGRRRWVIAGALCGAAFGMVISSLVVFVILPLMTLLRPGTWAVRARVALGAGAIGLLTYLVTNPYVPYNLLFNRGVMRSNLGASTAMYEVGGGASAMSNGIRLIAEGMSPVLFVAGVLGAFDVAGRARSNPASRYVWILLGVPTGVVLIQFFALGAGKPGEYGRFALLPDTALCLTAVALVYATMKRRTGTRAALALLVLTTGVVGATYVARFVADASGMTSRLELAVRLQHVNGPRGPVAVTAEPAPYCMPPVNLFDRRLLLLPRGTTAPPDDRTLVVRAVDVPVAAPAPRGFARLESDEPMLLRVLPSRISWAAKPFEVLIPASGGQGPNEPSRTPGPP